MTQCLNNPKSILVMNQLIKLDWNLPISNFYYQKINFTKKTQDHFRSSVFA